MAWQSRALGHRRFPRLALARTIVRSVVACVFALALSVGVAVAAEPLPGLRKLQDAASWTYQLQSVSVAELQKSHHDIVVIDAFFGGGAGDVKRLQTKPHGGRRIVLAQLSVGEAAVFRYYWSVCCRGGQKPDWLGAENTRWRGNYRVQYWNDEWKAIIYTGSRSYLKRIIDLGFDGVVLDRIDVHQAMTAPGVNARAEMITFVRELSAAAKKLRPGFLVVVQNAEDLLADDSYLSAIDAVAKEDLWYGTAGDGRRNDTRAIETSLQLLNRAHAAGRPILVVEYLQDPTAIDRSRTEILEHGFVPYLAPRPLNQQQVETLELDSSH